MKILNKKDINIVVDQLLKGKVLILPTDTIYGIACDATNDEAIAKVFNIKKRDLNKPLNLHLRDKSEVNKYAVVSSELEKKIIEIFMPGPLTLILEKKDSVSDLLTANMPTIGIRIPNDEFIMEVISRIKRPLVLTSANISNKKPASNLSDIDISIKTQIDFAVDIGEINEGIESTIIKVEKEKIKIIREGKIKREEIEKELNSERWK